MTTETPAFRIRYTPTGDGQAIFNDPRISKGLDLMASEATVLIDTVYGGDHQEEVHHRVSVIYGPEDVQLGPEGGDIIVHDRTVLRALRRAMGWHYGSHELINHAYSTGRAFHAPHDTDTIEEQ